MNKDKIVGDVIFGFITLKPHITAIIDTPEFQRLRMIMQLGLTSFVYPTAHNNRFEHSIGTYWLASKIVSKIQKQLNNEDSDIRISDKEVICVEIAALCHDIGHGPFSHFWDNKVLPNLSPNAFKHEQQFDNIWMILKENKSVSNMIEECSLKNEDIKLIDAIIKGDIVDGKEILFDIVNNKKSGMDVDKWDYLARDSTYLGQSTSNYRVDVERMLLLVRGIKDCNSKWKLAFRDTESLNIMRVFQLRHYMHQTAYQHRTAIAMELMMLDGIKRCIDRKIIMRDEIGTADWILKNTDAIFWSNINEIEEFKNILSRNLYKLILEATKYEVVINPEEELKKFLTSKNLCLDNLKFAFCVFQLGINISNPIFEVPFYNKNNDRNVYYFTQENVPSYLDLNYDESRILFFVKSLENEKNVDNIKDALSQHLIQMNWQISNSNLGI